ncbi:hypothetical protein FYK55_16345 [Roseiconus nitratireducens]|uniref:Uncharacterized protein n=1 Tax=Roseiconus nitratireducens TaxID=2605748 RepID=A0A5M6D2T7_9BACT|nr:hypothetical protein [Roseiconus nitratireducens]KAA5541781.1 hypothetical protein FYK55_16345 [Roseiconus nitratireducens]
MSNHEKPGDGGEQRQNREPSGGKQAGDQQAAETPPENPSPYARPIESTTPGPRPQSVPRKSHSTAASIFTSLIVISLLAVVVIFGLFFGLCVAGPGIQGN